MRNCGAPFIAQRAALARPPVVTWLRYSGAVSVSLTAQEGRDFQLIVLSRVIHRSLPAVLIEPLRSRPRRGWALGVFRD